MKAVRIITCVLVLVVLAGNLEHADAQQISRRSRAAWLTDQRHIPVGAIVTVVVDERTIARERTSRVADADRSSSLGLSAGTPDVSLPVTSADFRSSNNASSRNLGEANRRGDLSSIFTVSVVAVEPNGNLRIEGARTVEIDGRKQEWQLTGLIRPNDVSANNIVSSSRIADAQITYNGQDIGPRRGIISRILGIFWP